MSKTKSAVGEEEAKSKEIIIDTLETKWKGRPFLLGIDLDAAVQVYVQSLRIAGEVINTLVAMAAA